MPMPSLIIFGLFFVWSGLSVLSYDMEHTGENVLKDTDAQGFDIRQAISVLKAAISNISVYLGDIDIDTGRVVPPKCLKIQCRFICSNGRQSEIAKDISFAMAASEDTRLCDIIDELHLYNYTFPDATVPVGFLSIYTNKIKYIYISISNITTFENGAFGEGIFIQIILEDLRLKLIEKEFFKNISSHFKGLSIMQSNMPLTTVCPDFLDYVKFQLEYLRISTGLSCIRNITATDPILGKLDYADFSQNNFSSQLLEDTFRKLTMVEVLILSYSQIEYLPNYIFQGMKYLELLDISHNKLTTLSKNIFGVSEISSSLRIFATYNDYHCNCELQTEMNEIFKHHSSTLDMLCMSPEEYKFWTVFDQRICEHSASESVTTTTTFKKTTTATTTPTAKSTTDQIIYVPTISTAATVHPNEIVSLECFSANNTSTGSKNTQHIRWPQIDFFPSAFGALTVKITVDQSDSTDSFGLFWFSKTTKEYYMMELLPDEYGLGCYFTMPLQTIVTNLVPNVAYTFCLVDGQQTAVSPLSCKSIHISGNLDTYYNAWLSRSMRAKGISVMVLGVVLFMFMGITSVYLVLKKKPIWLKGSKRIVKPKYSSGEIVVLPRSNRAQRLQYKENMISRINQHRFIPFHSRHSSMESLASSDSYMETNLYEMIPAYLSFDKVPQADAPNQPDFELFDSSYWNAHLAGRNSVRYAQITPRTKRISSDPLPAIPSDVYDVPEHFETTMN